MNKLYVFAPTASGDILAGKFTWEDNKGKFEYTEKWLSHVESYALDPLNLPLHPGVFTCKVNKGVFGVLADAGPDSWGKHLMELSNRNVNNPIEYLRLTNGTGTGGLLFSQSRSHPNPIRSILPFTKLENIEKIIEDLEDGNQITHQDLTQLLDAGSYSLGGARPKALIEHQEKYWIAKFERIEDQINMPEVEQACLTLAKACGLPVPETELVSMKKRSILLVNRFDRKEKKRLHYLSAHALLSLTRVSPKESVTPDGKMTYAYCAELMEKLGIVNVKEDVFRRMVFNIYIGNTDDHLRNLGLLYDYTLQQWSLAPAFDLTALGGDFQAIGVGVEGRVRSLKNALSSYKAFGLTEERAQEIIHEMGTNIDKYKENCLQIIQNRHHRTIVQNRFLHQNEYIHPPTVIAKNTLKNITI